MSLERLDKITNEVIDEAKGVLARPVVGWNHLQALSRPMTDLRLLHGLDQIFLSFLLRFAILWLSEETNQNQKIE